MEMGAVKTATVSSACINCLPLCPGCFENCEESPPQSVVSSFTNNSDAHSPSENEFEFLSPDGSATEDAFDVESDSTLPSFVRITDNLHFMWSDVDGNSFVSLLDQAYDEIVHWKGNVFPLPAGTSGTENVCLCIITFIQCLLSRF